MKIKNVLISCGLALAMGLGIGAALISKEAPKVAKADNEITYKTYYFEAKAMNSSYHYWWADDSALTYMYAYSSTDNTLKNADWPGQRMSGSRFTDYVYNLSIDSRLDRAIFLRVNPNDVTDIWNRTSKQGGVDITLPNTDERVMQFALNTDFNSGIGYDDGNYAGVWRQYTFTVTRHLLHLDGTWTTDTVTLNRGQYVPYPILAYGESFYSWCLDPDFNEYAGALGGSSGGEYTDVYGYVRPSDMYTNKYDFTGYTGSDVLAGTNIKVLAYYSPEDDYRTFTIDSSLKGTFTYPENCTIIVESLVTDLSYSNSNREGCSYYNNRDVLIIENKNTEQNPKWGVAWRTNHDEPPTDGYYLVSSLNYYRYDNLNETFDNYLKLTELDPATNNGYIAKYTGYQAEEYEYVQILGFFNNSTTRYYPDEVYSFFHSQSYSSWYEDGGVYRYIYAFSVPYTYDFYLKSDGTFHIEPTESHVVTVNYVLFNPLRAGVETTRVDAIFVPDGEQFVWNLNDSVWLQGLEAQALCTRELYLDANLTIPFTGGYLTDDVVVYAKCYEDAPYLVGDVCLNGSNATPWTVDSGIKYNTVASQYKIKNDIFYQDLAVTINFTVPSTTTSSNPTQFGTLMMLNVAGGYQQYLVEPQYCPFSLAQEYDFASVTSDHLKITFTRGGNFTALAYASVAMSMDENGYTNAIIDIDVELFLLEEDNELANFVDGFLLSIGNVCKTDNTTDLDDLQTAWLQQKIVYNMLSDTSKTIIQAVGFNGGDESGNNIEKLVAKYAYIINKYGDDMFDDFIFNEVHSSPKINNRFSYSNVNVIIAAVIVSSSLILTVGLKLFYMKKKEQQFKIH